MNDHACKYCQSVSLDTRDKPPHIELYCLDCGRHQKFISKNSQPTKRPKLAYGTLDEVWKNAQDHCAHCGLSAQMIELLGLYRTMQHVPPFKAEGDGGYLIPLCSWCQQHSATKMKQLESLINRLAEKFDVRTLKV